MPLQGTILVSTCDFDVCKLPLFKLLIELLDLLAKVILTGCELMSEGSDGGGPFI